VKKRDENKGTIVFVVEKLNFQIGFSQRKRLELKFFLLQSCFFFQYESNKRKKQANLFKENIGTTGHPIKFVSQFFLSIFFL
jgi:hypothetical protein